jgi:hypothetical protein
LCCCQRGLPVLGEALIGKPGLFGEPSFEQGALLGGRGPELALGSVTGRGAGAEL